MNSISPPAVMRLISCPGCKVRQPESHFSARPHFNVCDTCLPDAKYSRSMQRKREEAELAFREILDKHHVPAMARAPKMDEALALLMQEFNGVHQFIHEYAEQLKMLIATKPGHPESVKALQAVVKLIHENNKRSDATDLEAMSLEQLGKAKEAEIFKMIAEMAMDRGKQRLLLRLLAPIEDAELIQVETVEVANAEPQS